MEVTLLNKIKLSWITILILSLLFYSCKPSGHSQNDIIKKRVIRVSYDDPVDFSSEIHLTAWIFQKYINDNSKTLEVKLYGSGILGNEREAYEALQLGAGATCVISGSAILNNFSPRTGVLDLSFLWQDYDHVHRVLDSDVGDQLSNDLDKIGIKVLGWLDSWGYRNIVTARKEIKSARDIKGLKIRTIQTPMNIAALNTMGANATPMAFGEIYSSLQTGVIDGFEHNATIVSSKKFYEVVKYMTLTKHLFGPLVFCFSKSIWNQLTPEEQKTVQDAAMLARDMQRALAPIREQEAMSELIKHGMIIRQIDRTPFINSAKALQDKLAKEIGAVDLLQKIRDAEKIYN